jgi:DNA-binding FadR family transcriptional regulator
MDDAQHTQVTERIIALIRGGSIVVGQRLPGERRLAELYGSCRNTIREVLKHLEDRGYVEIRKRSGCYVVSKDERPDWKGLKTSQTADIHQIIQAISIIGPAVAKLAAQSCSKAEMAGLNQITAGLGQAIVNHVSDEIIRHYARFYGMTAELVGNRYLTLLMRELEVASGGVAMSDMRIAKEDMDAFFALHVEMVNAMFSQDAHTVFTLSEDSVAALGRVFAPVSRVMEQ